MSSAKPTWLIQPAHAEGSWYSASPEGEALTTVLLRTYPAPQRIVVFRAAALRCLTESSVRSLSMARPSVRRVGCGLSQVMQSDGGKSTSVPPGQVGGLIHHESAGLHPSLDRQPASGRYAAISTCDEPRALRIVGHVGSIRVLGRRIVSSRHAQPRALSREELSCVSASSDWRINAAPWSIQSLERPEGRGEPRRFDTSDPPPLDG